MNERGFCYKTLECFPCSRKKACLIVLWIVQENSLFFVVMFALFLSTPYELHKQGQNVNWHMTTRVRRCIQKFPDWVDNDINNSLRSNTKVIEAKFTRLTHKIATQLHLVAESVPFAVLAPGCQSGKFGIHPRIFLINICNFCLKRSSVWWIYN